MADNIDDARKMAEVILDAQIRTQIAAIKPIPFTGECLSCEEPIETGRYCSIMCRIDHEEDLKRRKRLNL